METSYSSGNGEFDVNMFDQYIYKRNESNLDVSLSVPHYNGQHGQHYNMNDHTSSLNDTFFETSSPSSSPQRSFFDSDSSSSHSISPVRNDSPCDREHLFKSNSSDSMDVHDDDFFETHSSSSTSEVDSVNNMFSDNSGDDDEQELNESGFSKNLEMTFEEEISYWNDLMTCNRVLKPVLRDETSKKKCTNSTQTLQSPLKLNNLTPASGYMVYHDSVGNQKENNRIGILTCEEIPDSKETSINELERKPEIIGNLNNYHSLNKRDCYSELNGKQKTEEPTAQQENDMKGQQQNLVSNKQSSSLEDLSIFGQILPSLSGNTFSLEDFPCSQNIQTQDSLKGFQISKKGSIIPNLDKEYLCTLNDIPIRQKEIMSAIVAVFHNLSQMELEGSKLLLQVKARATWDICSMENDILTRKNTPEDSLKTIHFHHKNGKHRFILIVFLLSEIFKLMAHKSCCTKRELYYRNPQITQNQRSVDQALRDVCFLLKADLWEMNVFSSSKGLIAGPLKFRLKQEELIDCFNTHGTQIPADVSGLMEIQVDADLVLIVEKDTVFRRLLDDGILSRFPKKIIMVTSKGYPDVATRLLLKKIWDTYRTPMYALVDADPFGIEIYCVYKFGSLALSHQSAQLAVPSIQWIGLRPSHIALLDLKQLPLTARDQSRINELLIRPYISQPGCELEQELKLLQEMNAKTEIESLTDISVDYLISEYLPSQLSLII